MAKPKQKYLVEVRDNISVWGDISAEELARIEGVEQVLPFASLSKKSVWVDPRYDIEEVAQEIRELLAQEVPDVFRDE
jgi:hypothetical protein